MKLSKINCHFSVLAVLLTTALILGYSAGSDSSKGSTRAPLQPSGAASVLQADGVRPPPPPTLPSGQGTTASSQS
jgi:hypothetical protein